MSELYHYNHYHDELGRFTFAKGANGGVIKKGTKISSVSPVGDADKYKEVNNKSLYGFDPNDKWDSSVYKGPFALYKQQNMERRLGRTLTIFTHNYETTKDLVTPSAKERIDEFIKLYSEDKRIVVKDLKPIQDYIRKAPNLSPQLATEEAKNVKLKRLKTESDYKAAYSLFNHAMEQYNAFKSTKKYVEIMSTKWDAMIDDNNQGVYNNANNPVIIFRANEALKSIGTVEITPETAKKDIERVRKGLAKIGRNVAL